MKLTLIMYETGKSIMSDNWFDLPKIIIAKKNLTMAKTLRFDYTEIPSTSIVTKDHPLCSTLFVFDNSKTPLF